MIFWKSGRRLGWISKSGFYSSTSTCHTFNKCRCWGFVICSTKTNQKYNALTFCFSTTELTFKWNVLYINPCFTLLTYLLTYRIFSLVPGSKLSWLSVIFWARYLQFHITLLRQMMRMNELTSTWYECM